MRKFFQMIFPNMKFELPKDGEYITLRFNGRLIRVFYMIISFLFRNVLKVGFLALVVLFIFKNDFNVALNFNTNKDIIPNSAEQFSFGKTLGDFLDFDKKPIAKAESSLEGQAANVSQPATDWGNTYSNMTYGNKKKDTRRKREKQLAYVSRFKDVARSEMHKYGIPASITLAQGLIESNAGESRLSRENNNHFGMKCFSKSCRKGHCANFMDDSHKDFFRKYQTSWESYRAHSNLLMGKRYRGLKKHGKDYEKWAHGLKKAGYATDRRYAEKLIHIIKELKLYEFDH